MARGGERDTIIRLQRNVVVLALCLTFGVVFSKPGIQLMNDAYDIITCSLHALPKFSGVLTEDGDEKETGRSGHTIIDEDHKEALSTCPNGKFISAKGECVCYEERVNFVGHTYAKADDVETYRECQKLCESQEDCHYWSHFSGRPDFNSCFLKTTIDTISRGDASTDPVNFVSGSKTCDVPKTTDIRYDPSRVKLSKPSEDSSTRHGGNTHLVDDNMYAVIAEHCLPKLVCELHTKSVEDFESFSESERNLVSLIGATTISGTPSKYHFAAHFGQLIRGVESQGCMNFYPKCPFSGSEVRKIARKIAKTK